MANPDPESQTQRKPIRATREIFPLQGIGGFLGVRWTMGTSGEKPTDGEKVEVREWLIEHIYRNVEIPESGGKGSITNYRVADSFRFVALLDLDLTSTLKGPVGKNFAGQPHPDGKFQGNADDESAFGVAIRFQCGDPTWWSDPALQSVARVTSTRTGIYYFCPRVLLTEVRVVTNSTGKPGVGLVNAIVRGVGSAPLERYVEEKLVGFGGLGFDPPVVVPLNPVDP